MGKEVEDACGVVGANPQANKHIAKLTDGGVGQDTLDVVLHQANAGSKEGGKSADICHNFKCLRASVLKDQEGARDEVDACRDHRGGVNQGANWRWAFHRIWQPDMQRELG